ncbi:MAG TPA: hypothetical protein VH415_05290 [Nitrososphaeraceae archaeon]
MKEVAKHDKDPSKNGVYMVSYPTILESSPASNEPRTPMTGAIEQIGSDIEQLNAIGTDHLILGHIFSPLTKDVRKILEVTKQLHFTLSGQQPANFVVGAYAESAPSMEFSFNFLT